MGNERVIEKRVLLKLILVMVIFFLVFMGITARLVKIQIVDQDIYKAKAKAQHEANRTLVAKRGKIIDRNNQLLVISNNLYTIAVDPQVLKKDTRVYEILSYKTGVPAIEYIHKVMIAVNKRLPDTLRYVELTKNFKEKDVSALKALHDKGVIIISKPIRNYIQGSDAAQLIGITNIDNKGISGLEMQYDTLLKGKNGTMVCMRDGKGRLYLSPSLPTIPAQDGNTLQLTIDINLQKIVEYELKQGALLAEARSATVVVVEPQSGDVLAMASYPSYNPMNRKTATNNRIRNRAITDQYDPGSTFKIITAAAALEEGIIEEDDTLKGYNGAMRLYDRLIRDDHGGGDMTFREAIEHSSNIAFAQLAMDIPFSGGYSLFPKYIRDFGFGLQTGIDLKGEISGRFPSPKEFRKKVTRAYAGHGYGVNVTSLQLAMAYAAVANNGRLMKPRLVKKIISAQGKVIKKFPPELIRKVISKETARRLKKLFVGVVENGTGKKAAIKGMSISGKTGTSKQWVDGGYKNGHYNASFAGFFPEEEPKIVMFVIVDRPKNGYYGGSVAAPIFRNIAARWSQINPDFAQQQYDIDSVFNIKKSLLIDDLFTPSLIGMNTQNAKNYLSKYNLELETENYGIIRSQHPKPRDVLIGKKIKVQTFKTDIGMEMGDKNRKKPSVVHLPMRRAITVLHNAGFIATVSGFGTVISENWTMDINNTPVCHIKCK